MHRMSSTFIAVSTVSALPATAWAIAPITHGSPIMTARKVRSALSTAVYRRTRVPS